MIFKWLQGKKASPSLKDNSRAGTDNPSGAEGASNADPMRKDGPASGLEMTDAYYPRHDPIDYYGDGGFRFGSMSHQGAILFLPSGIHRWDVETPTSLKEQDFAKILREAGEIEILLIGTGNSIIPLAPSLAAEIRSHGLKLDMMDTGAAVRTLNILLSEDRAVAAALFPVD